MRHGGLGVGLGSCFVRFRDRVTRNRMTSIRMTASVIRVERSCEIVGSLRGA